jgi:MarR family 2-MHQ and catechol resistance regulon transcriptional repressor
MGEIGQRLVVTKSNVTGLVSRLERRRLVLRSDHSDGRAKIVRLTRRGVHLLERALPQYEQVVGELTECLTEREKRTIVRLLTKLRRELRRRKREEQ